MSIRHRSRRSWSLAAVVVAVAGSLAVVAGGVTPAGAATVPGAPTGVQLVVGHSGLMEVSWTAPVSDGGSPILTYWIRLQADDPGQSYWASPTAAQVPVDYGITYHVSVAAENALGRGAWSTAAVATPLPLLSVGNAASVVEADAGTTTMSFPVSLDATSAAPVTVSYTTVNGTAKAPADYVATSGTLTFSPGIGVVNVPVTINGDVLHEADETLKLSISAPSGATIKRKAGVGRILDDDPAPTISIDDLTRAEGSTLALATFSVPVRLSAVSGLATKVSWHTVDGTATSASGDYSAASGTLSIAAGRLSGAIKVKVMGDRTAEPTEAFSVVLTSAIGGSIVDGTGIVTLTNDD